MKPLSVKSPDGESKFRNKSSSFPLFSSKSADSCAGGFICHKWLLCACLGREHARQISFYTAELKEGKLRYALGDYIETSITSHKSPRQIPFYPKKATRKMGTESHRPGFKSWLYHTIWVIFSKVSNFFEPHLFLLCYGNLKISINGHCWINWDKCKIPALSWDLMYVIFPLPFNTKDMMHSQF